MKYVRNFGKDKKMVAMFFNSIFLSIDDKPQNAEMKIWYIKYLINQNLITCIIKYVFKKFNEKHLDRKRV